MTVMLDHITTIDYVPRTNLKGKGIGANWVFLLPRLEFERVLCIGSPPEDMLPALRLLSDNVICTRPVAGGGLIVRSLKETPSSSIDFIYVADLKAVTVEELQRILKPDGLLYYEHYGQDHTGFSTPKSESTTSRFWLTPSLGSVQTAVAVDQVRSVDFLFDRQLWTPTVRHQTLDRLGKRLLGKSSLPTATQEEGELATSSSATKKNRSLKRSLYAMLRGTRNSFIRSTTWTEKNLLRSSFTRRWIRRYGVIVQKGSRAGGKFPDYLQAGAERSGVDIRQWDWTYVARGDYPSQKLLFYLFAPNTNKPSIVAKMVREPEYNERLEREYHGLKHLGDLKFVHGYTIPQILFHGYHRGLFFVGERVLNGVPFAQKTTFDANCNYASFVVQWLIDLGAATRTAGNGEEIASLIKPLYERFVKVYGPNRSQQEFLKQQLDRLSCAANIPLVLRHGDLGLQNLLVTDEGTVAFLDWENAELKGFALWDLFHFLSAYCAKAGQVRANLSSLEAYENYFLNNSLLQPFVLDAVDRYYKKIDLDRDLILPMYYIFWMYRALKQSTMLSPAQIQNGSAWRVLQLGITMRDSPTLRAWG